MSAWKREAVEQLPECRQIAQAAENPTALWIGLLSACREAHAKQDEDLIRRFYDFAHWCWKSTDDVRTAVARGFYEHLPPTRVMRRDMPRRFGRAFSELRDVFRRHLTPAEAAALDREFLGEEDMFEQIHGMLDEAKKLTPASQPASSTPAPVPNCGIICFSTSRFDEMKRFLAAMGFVVTEGSDQLLPLFSQGRGARVQRGNFEFNLEEDLTKQRAANFDYFLTDLSDDEIDRAKTSGFEYSYERSLYGDVHTFKSPDGGTFVI